MQNSGVTAGNTVKGFYDTYRAAYDAKPYTAADFAAQTAAETGLVTTPAESLGDVVLKMSAAIELEYQEDLIKSAFGDLKRLAKASPSLAIAA